MTNDTERDVLRSMLPLTVDWLIEAQREAVRKAYERIAALDGHA